MSDPSPARPAERTGASKSGRERTAFARGLLAGFLLALLATGLLYLWMWSPVPGAVVVHAPPAVLMSAGTPLSITVHISGEVTRPGVYELEEGARVLDALAAAGGMTADAAADRVNQALALSDGAHVVVPAFDAEAEGTRAGEIAVITETEGSLVVNTLLNINTATLDELMELPGIGEVRAGQIIAGRPYTTVDALDDVPGIGPVMLGKLRQLVTAP